MIPLGHRPQQTDRVRRPQAGGDGFRQSRQPGPLRLSDKARVRAVLPEIQRRRAAGWSYEEIRQEMANTLGFQGTRQTLYNYVSQLSSSTPASPSSAGPVSEARPVSPPTPHAAPTDVDHSALPASPTQTPSIPPGRRSLSQTLGGPQAREALKESREKKPERKTLVDRLNEPI